VAQSGRQSDACTAGIVVLNCTEVDDEMIKCQLRYFELLWTCCPTNLRPVNESGLCVLAAVGLSRL